MKFLSAPLKIKDIRRSVVTVLPSQANSSVPRSGMLGAVTVKKLPTKNFSLRGETLREAVNQDIKDGKIPFFVSAPFLINDTNRKNKLS